MPDISRKIIKPEDCIFAFGIPTTKDEFHKDVESLKKDFVNYHSIWSEYYKKIVSSIESIEQDFLCWNVKIIRRLTLDDFERLFIDGRDVIILFSHWINPDKIEFYDKIYNTHSVLQKIPIDFTGILDLCVCHPKKIVETILQERPNCLTKYIDIGVTPSYWLFFYGVLFKLLTEKNMTYLEALEETVRLLLDKNHKIRAKLWSV